MAWARSTLNLYYPYGRRAKSRVIKKVSVNEQRAKDAQQRILDAVQQLRETFPIPLLELPVRDLARHITRLAQCSLTTLYKYTHLWQKMDALPTDQLRESPVTVNSEAVSRDLISEADPLKPHEDKVLHTRGGSMKCRSRRSPSEEPLRSKVNNKLDFLDFEDTKKALKPLSNRGFSHEGATSEVPKSTFLQSLPERIQRLTAKSQKVDDDTAAMEEGPEDSQASVTGEELNKAVFQTTIEVEKDLSELGVVLNSTLR